MQPKGSKNKTEIREWKQRHIAAAYGLPGRWEEEGEALFFSAVGFDSERRCI